MNSRTLCSEGVIAKVVIGGRRPLIRRDSSFCHSGQGMPCLFWSTWAHSLTSQSRTKVRFKAGLPKIEFGPGRRGACQLSDRDAGRAGDDMSCLFMHFLCYFAYIEAIACLPMFLILKLVYMRFVRARAECVQQSRWYNHVGSGTDRVGPIISTSVCATNSLGCECGGSG